MAFIEVIPRELSKEERASLLLALKLEHSDSQLTSFIVALERALAKYVILRRQYAEKATGSEARSACDAIGRAAKRLQTVWENAPFEALQILDFAGLL